MPSENSVNLANLHRKNLPHIASALDVLEPLPVLKGLFRFEHKNQAYNLPISHRYHQIQTITTVSPAAFSSSNYFYDFNLPMNADLVDDLILEYTLQNTGMTAWTASASAPWMFQRIEVRIDNEIKQTKRDIQLYLDNTVYLNDFDRQKNKPMIGLDTNTYQASATDLTIQSGASKTFKLRLRTFLDTANIFLKGIRGQIVIRVYPQAIGVFGASGSAGNTIALQSSILLMRELELSQDGRNKMMMVHRSNVDYRYLDVVHEQTTLNMIANATTKYVTNNFHDTLYSHVVVLTRVANPTLAQLETFLQCLNMYFEDVSSMNLSNGIQWTDDDLRQVVYQSHFPNAMSQVVPIYVPLCATENAEESYKKGVQNGYEVLPRNAKLCINPSASGTNQVDILCYAYTHCRVESGKIHLF